MAEVEEPMLKSLDGTVQSLHLGANQVTKPEAEMELSPQSQQAISAYSKDSIPPPGQQLTGKQEHCGF